MAKRRKPNKANQRRIIETTVSKLQGELINQGLTPGAALNFARLALSKQQGVSIGGRGRIHRQGKVYDVASFAKSPLIDYVTGKAAEAKNRAAIESDPTYQMSINNLQLNRDQSLAQLADERRNNLIDFGDANFALGDPVLAAAIKANPFSTSNLLAEANRRNVNAVTDNANVAGTIFGGGLRSGLAEAQRRFAGDSANALTTLTRYLSQNNQQQTNLNQTYDLGMRNAYLQAQQALTVAGLIDAATPPRLGTPAYKFWQGGGGNGPPRGGNGGGGAGNAGGGGRPPTNGPPRNGGGGGGGIPNPPPPPGHGPGPIAPPPPPPRRIVAPPSPPYHPPTFHRRRRFAPPPPRPR